jgi:hypothetical protein
VTADEYILSVVSRYNVQRGPDSPAFKAGVQLSQLIAAWGDGNLFNVQISGSYAKGTGITGSTDIDLLLSLKSDTPGTPKDIYYELYKWLDDRHLSPSKRNVSIGLWYSGVSVDLVPARKESGNSNNDILFKNKSQSWIETNVQMHTKLISESGLLNEIRSIKIWRNLNKLTFPSFYLELTVLEALRKQPTHQLASNLLEVLRYLRDTFTQSRVVDPANSDNVVSDDLTSSEKALIQEVARDSCFKSTCRQILW